MRSNSDFKVAGSELPSDTIISYVLGILSAIFIVICVVKSIASLGNVERIYGVLMMSAMVMSFTGGVFGIIGYRNEDGSVNVKKLAIYISVITFIVAGLFLIKGM